MYDYSKLCGKIREKFGTQGAFANALGISSTTLSYKLNNKIQWTQEEIDRAVELIGESEGKIPAYFFTKKVREVEL